MMKELSEMSTRDFIDSLLHKNEKSKLEVYDELDRRTHGFNLACVEALLDLMFNQFPFLDMTPDERDMRYGLMTIEEWNLLQHKPSPSTHTIVINEIDDCVKIRPKEEELFWYAYDILNDILNGSYNRNGEIPPLLSQHCDSDYILAAFNNNSIAAEHFIKRIFHFPGKRITTLVAIDMSALKSIGILNYGTLTVFTEELNNLLKKNGQKPIGYQGLHAALTAHEKKDNRVKAAISYYEKIVNIKSE